MNTAALGMALAAERRRAGLTQAAVAKMMRTSQAAVSRVESGWVTAPTVDWIERYALALGRPLTLTFGSTSTSEQRRESAEAVLGRGFTQNPWERQPSDEEIRSLESRRLKRERFRRAEAARPG